MWIAETLDGECSHANLIQVDLEHDKPIARQTALRDFNSWVQLKQQLQNAIEYEEPIEILPENGVLLLRKRNARLVTPDRNQSLEKDYLRDFSAECARKWNDATREAGIDLPTVNGKLQLKLLYYSPDGLYFNYSIDKAYYFANSNLICIFTKNNFFKCNSQVTSMHGFMILEIK
ncbi:MAG: hypothetical protein RMJ87_04820 [Cytophagales bacterium]|nr:hypothetical protein [Cytophagales bacterium]